MLRVRIDCCEVVDGLTRFEGVPLSGVGVSVATAADVGDRPGRVRLWRYIDGERVGPWVDPQIMGDQAFIVEWNALDDMTDEQHFHEEEYILLDGHPFDGYAVWFDGAHLRGIYRFTAGGPHHWSKWTSDGTLGDYRTSHDLGEIDGYRVDVREDTWLPRPGGADNGRKTQSVVVSHTRVSDGAFDSGLGSEQQMQVDQDGHLTRWSLSRDLYRSVEQLGGRLSLWRDDHVLSWAQVPDLVLAEGVAVSMSESLARRAVDALGGFDAFNEVTQLQLSVDGWTAEWMEQFGAIDSLETLRVVGCPADASAMSKVLEEIGRRVTLEVYLNEPLE